MKRHPFKRFAFLSVLWATICWSAPLDAGFNPIKIIGDAAGGVFRGVGSILGQGIAGLAGPTIDDAANQMQRVAGGAIDAADRAAGRRIDQLNDKIVKAIEETDAIVTKHLAELDEILTKKLGAIDIIGTKQINNFEQSISEIVRYASLLFLITAGIFVVFTIIVKRYSTGSLSKFGFDQIAAVCCLLFVCSLLAFGASFIITPPSQAKLVALKNDLLKSYKYAMRLGDLNGATFYASQLNSLDSANFASRLLVETADIQRDLLMRPALIKTPKGALELNSRISRLERTWDLVQETKADSSSVAFLEYELNATAAMILWQSARTEQDEVVAACAAHRALLLYSQRREIEKSPDLEDASPYIWLAYAYANWASVRDLQGNWKCNDGSTLSSSRETLKPLLTKFDTSTRPNPLVDQVIRYDRAATNYYVKASRLYSTILVTDTQFRYKAPPEKPPHRLERDAAAADLLAAWDEFVKVIKTIPGLQGSNLVLATNGLPFAIMQRALLLKGADNRPAFDLAACNAISTQMAGTDVNARNAAEATGLAGC